MEYIQSGKVRKNALDFHIAFWMARFSRWRCLDCHRVSVSQAFASQEVQGDH